MLLPHSCFNPYEMWLEHNGHLPFPRTLCNSPGRFSQPATRISLVVLVLVGSGSLKTEQAKPHHKRDLLQITSCKNCLSCKNWECTRKSYKTCRRNCWAPLIHPVFFTLNISKHALFKFWVFWWVFCLVGFLGVFLVWFLVGVFFLVGFLVLIFWHFCHIFIVFMFSPKA